MALGPPGLTGVVLAGGAGRRIGGDKAVRPLAGRPLVAYPVTALESVCERVAVVVKPATKLPPLARVERWTEPAEPRHPVTGLIFALERAGGSILVCAADMPFVTADACRALIAAGGSGAVTVAAAGRSIEPLLAVYRPAALEALRRSPPDIPMRTLVEALGPVRVALPQSILRSVNTLDDLRAAECELGARR